MKIFVEGDGYERDSTSIVADAAACLFSRPLHTISSPDTPPVHSATIFAVTTSSTASTAQVHYLKNPIDVQGTLNRLPFFMDAEKSMMQALIRGGPKAHVDALKAVPKNLQLMYL